MNVFLIKQLRVNTSPHLLMNIPTEEEIKDALGGQTNSPSAQTANSKRITRSDNKNDSTPSSGDSTHNLRPTSAALAVSQTCDRAD